MKKRKKYKPSYVGSQGIKKTPAWKVFSLYIRKRDGACISCGYKQNYKVLDCGHFISGNICGKELFFSEINNNGQCKGCNRFRHGNGSAYALSLTRKHGVDVLERLEKTRREEKEKGIICRYTKDELKEIEEKYKAKLHEQIS